MNDESKREVEAARLAIEAKLGRTSQILIILGSGLGSVREGFRVRDSLPYGEIPGFPVSTVSGHRGQLLLAERNRKHIFIMDGRVHLYEGYPFWKVTLPVVALIGAGVRKVIVTNAAGSVSPFLEPGDLMIIVDHINMMWGKVRVSNLKSRRMPYYNRSLIEAAIEIGMRLRLPLKTGVLLATTGPSYETPAEVEFARKIGADAVTMSTIPEVTVCRTLGVPTLGISLITNRAARHIGGHKKVVDFASRSSENLKELLQALVDTI